jgi:hypothetical protein
MRTVVADCILSAVLLFGALPTDAADASSDAAPAALGTLEARTRTGALERLALQTVSVDVRLAGDVAETRVEHVFHNPSSDRLEGTFRFPIPEDGIPVGLAMEIDGRLVEASLFEREAAQRIYQSIVDSMRDPAILEWDRGQILKLRVFPIEPNSDKRIVVRYVSPLEREGETWSYVYPAAGLLTAVPSFRLDFQSQCRIEAKDYLPGQDVVIPIAAAEAPATVLREARRDGLYTAVRLRPDWTRLELPRVPGPLLRSVLVIVDVSRSMIESRRLVSKSLSRVLGSLSPGDRFLVMTMDVTTSEATSGFVAATSAAVDTALELVTGIEPDGASDLEAALRRAGELAAAERTANRTTQVIYIGDGRPTWGETDPAALRRLAAAALQGIELDALALGREPDLSLLADLARDCGGRAEHPRSVRQVEQFVRWLASAATLPRLFDVRLSAEGHSLLPRERASLFEGDEIVALVRTPEGHEPPAAIVLEGRSARGSFRQELPVRPAVMTPHVAQRWATLEIARLEAEKATREEVLAVSKAFGVLSRYTAFLVVEDAMRRQIEQESERQPEISGRDLESLDARASLSPDRIQPGDPEISVEAPADAHSVVLVFPWGETKAARYEPALRRWTVRFLIDANTPDGRYPVLVKIARADGRVETVTLSYTVDTRPPSVALAIQPGPRGSFSLIATQVAEDGVLERDARRVEVRTPDGQTITLARAKDGTFQGTWRPRRRIASPLVLKVVAVDRALNRRVTRVTLDLPASQVAAR